MDTKTASEIMTRDVKTIAPDATLREAAEMLAFNGVSGAPVVDDEGHIIGIITDSDLMNEAKKRAALPHVSVFGLFLAPEEALRRIYHEGADLLVEEIMSKDVETVTGDIIVREIANLMTRRRINRIPVVDTDNKLVGIITRADIMRTLFELPRVH
ncbi:MAG: CBS domain-containing protein [Armatimonas sp.]